VVLHKTSWQLTLTLKRNSNDKVEKQKTFESKQKVTPYYDKRNNLSEIQLL